MAHIYNFLLFEYTEKRVFSSPISFMVGSINLLAMNFRLSCRRLLFSVRERSGLRGLMKNKSLRCERCKKQKRCIPLKLIYRTYLGIERRGLLLHYLMEQRMLRKIQQLPVEELWRRTQYLSVSLQMDLTLSQPCTLKSPVQMVYCVQALSLMQTLPLGLLRILVIPLKSRIRQTHVP